MGWRGERWKEKLFVMRLALGAKLIHWGELFDVYLIMDVYLSWECEFMGWAASPGSWFNLFLLFSSAGTKRKGGCEDGWVGLNTIVKLARIQILGLSKSWPFPGTSLSKLA